MALVSLLCLLLASRARAWTELTSRDGGFPEPSAAYYRLALAPAQLVPGSKVRLAVVCPKARYFSVSVYDQAAGALLASADDRVITGETDPARPPCEPGRGYGLSLVSAASGGRERELVVPGLTGRKGAVEVWFRAYLGEGVKPPVATLVGSDGRDVGPPAEVPVRAFPTEMSLVEAARQAKRLPPEPRGDRLVVAPTDGSGWFPNGHAYLHARLDSTNPLTPRRFKGRPLLGGEQFAVVRFRAPGARYWSLCMYDAPSSTLLRDGDGGACVNDAAAKAAPGAEVSVLLGSPAAAARARALGALALPVYYRRSIVAMPLLLLRVIPEGPVSPGGLPGLEGRFFPVGDLEAAAKAAAGGGP